MCESARPFLFAVALFAIAVSAQQLDTAGIYGKVTDPQGALILGAKVILTDVARHQDRVVITNAQGSYAFPLQILALLDQILNRTNY